MTIKLVQLGEDGLACEGGVCAIPAVLAGAQKQDTPNAKSETVTEANQKPSGPARGSDRAEPLCGAGFIGKDEFMARIQNAGLDHGPINAKLVRQRLA